MRSVDDVAVRVFVGFLKRLYETLAATAVAVVVVLLPFMVVLSFMVLCCRRPSQTQGFANLQ